VSSAQQGWYVDPSTGTNLRFWSGSTWTDEVAPLPYEPTHSGPVDLFAQAEALPAESEPEPAADASAEGDPLELDAALERTRLSRRELRARRGSDGEPDDTPRHLPPLAPPAAMSVDEWSEPVEELEIPARAPAVPGRRGGAENPEGRRRRVIRMSVLLALLAVVTSVAVLTAGTL
jgi:hypothetical protein